MGEFTYEHLFDVLRKERSREELQQLEEGFYATAQGYIQRETDKLSNMDVMSSQGDRLRVQVQNARKLLKELYDRREKKIMLLALNKARTGSNIIDTSSLLSSEQKLYETVVRTLSTFRDSISSVKPEVIRKPSALTASMPAPKSPQTAQQVAPSTQPKSAATADGTMIRITAAIPRFLGGKDQSFGPFSEGDEVSVPDNIARILVKKGRAQEL